MTLPNFLIIGAAKSGTTALYHYMRQHPQVFMTPRKESHFFGQEGTDPTTHGPGDSISRAITTLSEYEALYADVRNEKAIGEACPTYIYVPRAVSRIKHHIPNARLIAILRHPADRAYSAFMHLVRDNRETVKSFEKALELEDERFANNWGPLWHYTRGGRYHEQLSRYYDTFDRGQIRVYIYEEFRAQPAAILADAFQFLDVDSDWLPDLRVRPNVSGVPRNRFVQSVLQRLFMEPNPIKTLSRKIIPLEVRWRSTTAIWRRNLRRPTINPDTRRWLTGLFQEDILRLQDLISKDLSIWLE